MRPRRREPAPDIYRLVLPLPFEGLNHVNAYAVAGDPGPKLTLVDCGIFEDGRRERPLRDALEACGSSLGDVGRLIVTHPHPDHYGLAAALVETTGCELWMHSEADRELDAYRKPEVAATEVAAAMSRHGVGADDDVERIEEWRQFVSGVVEASTWLEGGERFEAGGRRWQVLHTPGHSRAHVCVWSSDEGILLSGDTLLGSITPHVDHKGGLGADPLGDFLSSLRKIEDLDPALVLAGHGRPFSEGAERARAIARHHDRRLGSILQVIRHEPHSAAEVADAVFGNSLLNYHRRLALGETLAHLEYLRLRGEAELVDDDGSYRYLKTTK